jgi:hypothetical protein
MEEKIGKDLSIFVCSIYIYDSCYVPHIILHAKDVKQIKQAKSPVFMELLFCEIKLNF